MFWLFEKENIYPKENRAFRLLLMYYWDQIAQYPNVEEFRISETESINYYYAVKRALDCKESAFINDMYNIWRILKVNALKSDLSSYGIDVEDACDIYDLIISQLRSVVYDQKIEMFCRYRHEEFYNEATKIIDIIIKIRYDDKETCLKKWPYIGAIAYYWDLVFKRPIDLKNEKEITNEYVSFKQHYERYDDSDFLDFQIININQNYSTLKVNMSPHELEFIKDILYALRDIKLY